MIPVHDAAGLPLLLRALPPVDEVVVVADPSAADAAAAVRRSRPDALLVHPDRPGPGAALACGIAAGSSDAVVILNGDGSTDPSEIPRFVDALVGGADVVLGSRYRDGGRDLTGGRLRRWADLMLIWWVNVLFGTRRTDPGFGYAAFWRDAAARLDLPGPAQTWGDGPEIGPLIALRAVTRGLTVAEVPCVAHPRMRRAERASVRHWVRAALGEYSRRGRRIARHSTATVAATRPPAPVAGSGSRLPASQTGSGSRLPAPQTGSGKRPPSARTGSGSWLPAPRTGFDIRPRTPWAAANPRPPSWPAGDSPDADPQPRTADHPRPAPFVMPPAGPVVPGNAPRREVGSRRRRLEAYRQPRPDLRVINGEGRGSRNRSGGLRSVPRHPGW